MNTHELEEKKFKDAQASLENSRSDLSFFKLHGKSISKEDKLLAKTQKKLREIMEVLVEYDF